MTEYEMATITQANRELIINIGMFIATFISVMFIYWDYRSRKSKERAEHSILLAKDFSNIMVYRLSLLCTIFEKKDDVNKILTKVKFTNFTDFDNTELQSLYSKEDIKSIITFIETSAIDTGKDKKAIMLRPFIMETLNSLEYMCMYISTNIADEKYIYNSLHQMFLQSIQTLYICISTLNTDDKDKYYTNIIHVYNLWKERYLKFCKKEEKMRRKLAPKIIKTK